jgi:hypothetical protein
MGARRSCGCRHPGSNPEAIRRSTPAWPDKARQSAEKKEVKAIVNKAPNSMQQLIAFKKELKRTFFEPLKVARISDKNVMAASKPLLISIVPQINNGKWRDSAEGR